MDLSGHRHTSTLRFRDRCHLNKNWNPLAPVGDGVCACWCACVCACACLRVSVCVRSVCCLSVRSSVCPSVRLSVCPSVRLLFCPSVRLSVCPSVRPSVCPSIFLSVCPSVRPSVRLSVCPSVGLSVCPSVGLSVSVSVAEFLTADCRCYCTRVRSAMSMSDNITHDTAHVQYHITNKNQCCSIGPGNLQITMSDETLFQPNATASGLHIKAPHNNVRTQ
jgi:hypothetical protein